ncbi:MAG: hypothetical protein WC043_03680 [Pseudobdellovibrionaceae bacterium]
MNSKIQIEADDFLKAYQVLADNYDSATLAIMGPSVVCLAFAVELYIKDLHFVLTSKPARGHNILNLFEALPLEIRQEIFSQNSINQNPFTTRGDIFSPKRFSETYTPYERFIDQIQTISKGFEKWRYSYESTTLRYDSSFALALIEAIRSVANTHRK